MSQRSTFPSNQLLLPEPFGFGKGTGISIQGPHENFYEIGEIVQGFGCPLYTTNRVRSSIKHSGRYDCIVSPSVNISSLARELAMAGATVEVTSERKIYALRIGNIIIASNY